MSKLKPGDRALVRPHPTDVANLGGKEVTLVRITNIAPRSTIMYGTMWEVDFNGEPCTCAEILLQKIDPPKPEDSENSDTPDKQVSWDSCVWKPAGVTIE